MTPEAWTTVAVVGAMVLVMVRTNIGPDMVMVGGVTVLLAFGVLSPAEAFAGFGNPALITIAALLVVAAGIRDTGALEYVGRVVLGRPLNLAGAQMRMMFPVAALSAFLNNTPVVAMFIPLVSDWARRSRLSVSMLLMPLSYAAILGGTCTLIGTSTNLVVAGLALEHAPDLRFGMFQIAAIGLPAMFLGVTYVVLASRRLLRDRTGVDTSLGEQRKYTIAMRVEKGSPVIGQTIEEAGLRSLDTLYLYEVERGGNVFPAVPPSHVLLADDRLHFTGVVDNVVDLRKMRIVPDTDQVGKISRHPERRLVEAVVAPQSSLVGRTVRQSAFRTQYDAAIIAVHRQGIRVSAKVGDIVLEPGDVVLLETHPQFTANHRWDPNFALVAEVEDSNPPRYEKAWIAAVLMVGMVVLNTAELLDLMTAALLAAGLMLVTRCTTGNVARKAIDVPLLTSVGAAFGISAALAKTGAAVVLSESILALATPFGPLGVLTAIYAATALLTGVLTNAAAAAIMFPIAAAAAETQHIGLLAVSYLVMIGASSAFSTPIGYQTNLMVWGPGGYRYADFLRLGLPLQVMIGLVSVVVAGYLWL